ncbi:MAG: hypothetical protein ACLRWM_05875 [Streptococcus sp.]
MAERVFQRNGMKTDEWYDSQIEVLVKCYDAINNIFHVDEIHDTIEISDYLESYDQLKELLAMHQWTIGNSRIRNPIWSMTSM